jgi:hypothetical protein
MKLTAPKLNRTTLIPGAFFEVPFLLLGPGALAHLMSACEDHGPTHPDVGPACEVPEEAEDFWGPGGDGWRVRVIGCPAGVFSEILAP